MRERKKTVEGGWDGAEGRRVLMKVKSGRGLSEGDHTKRVIRAPAYTT